MRKPAQYLWTKGFTLIELLIVIALIGILAVALLSVINPLEQLKKARDSGKKSDSAELLNAYERFYSTFGCFPWALNGAATCPATYTIRGLSNPDFTVTTADKELSDKEEVKEQVKNRFSGAYALKFWVTESSKNQVSICFEPESKTARLGGSGATKDITNTNAATCTGSYSGGGAAATCYVCIPQ